MTKRKLLDRREVERMVSMSRSSLYEAMARSGFPRPIRVGKRSVRWIEDEILEWMERREPRRPFARRAVQLKRDRRRQDDRLSRATSRWAQQRALPGRGRHPPCREGQHMDMVDISTWAGRDSRRLTWNVAGGWPGSARRMAT